MTNLYHKIIFNIRTNGKSVYSYISIRKSSPRFTFIVYDYDTKTKQYVKVRAITSGESPINITNFIKAQIKDIYGAEYTNIEIKEIDNKLFNFVIKQSK